MGPIERAYKRREDLDEIEKNRGTEEEERIKLIIKIFKACHNRDPTEKEIEDHIHFILRCKKEIFGHIRE